MRPLDGVVVGEVRQPGDLDLLLLPGLQGGVLAAVLQRPDRDLPEQELHLLSCRWVPGEGVRVNTCRGLFLHLSAGGWSQTVFRAHCRVSRCRGAFLGGGGEAAEGGGEGGQECYQAVGGPGQGVLREDDQSAGQNKDDQSGGRNKDDQSGGRNKDDQSGGQNKALNFGNCPN